MKWVALLNYPIRCTPDCKLSTGSCCQISNEWSFKSIIYWVRKSIAKYSSSIYLMSHTAIKLKPSGRKMQRLAATRCGGSGVSSMSCGWAIKIRRWAPTTIRADWARRHSCSLICIRDLMLMFPRALTICWSRHGVFTPRQVNSLSLFNSKHLVWYAFCR